MTQRPITIAALALIVGAGSSMLATQAAAQLSEQQQIGKAEYLRYCSACHGAEGKGDGIVGTFLRPKPSDLTQLAKNNNGEFPFVNVMRVIDGRKGPKAHGESEMPVWGEIFHAEAGSPANRQLEVQGKIMVITEYLRSLQVK